MVETKRELPNIISDFLSGQARKKVLQVALDNPEILSHGPVTLSSGEKSDWYFDARYLNSLPEGAYWTSLALMGLIRNNFPQAQFVGGSGLDGSLVTSVILGNSWCLYNEGSIPKPFSGFLVDDDGKINGHCGETNNLVVEGTVTTGASVLKTIKQLTKQGKQIEGIVAILDRGGGVRITQAGYKFVSLFTPRDLGIED